MPFTDQHLDPPFTYGEGFVIAVEHTEDMTSMALRADFKNKDATEPLAPTVFSVNTAGTGGNGSVAVGAGENGPGTRATVTALPAAAGGLGVGRKFMLVQRTDGGDPTNPVVARVTFDVKPG